MKKLDRKEILVLFSAVIIGFALRFHTFDQKSLWIDEIHTFNDSRTGFRGQIEFYKDNPTFLHPPLFFVLTHLFYPFPKPERDLRIIPLIFGTLSIPMFYLLTRQFSGGIAVPCTLSLTFMTYHISLSQDGRSYSLLLFLGMVGLYFWVRHLTTLNRTYLFLAALFYSILFHTSYSSIPFMALSQILWRYRYREETRQPRLSSILMLNGLILLFCLPWIIFLAGHYHFKGEPLTGFLHVENPGSFFYILNGVFNDWVPHAPLTVCSVALLILFPILSKSRRNALILLSTWLLPIGGLYLFCKLLNITHFVTSRYFINFLPPFLIAIYLSLETLELRLRRLKGFLRPKLLFLVLFTLSNLILLPLYYSSQKQDFRGLVNSLKAQLQDGDKIFISEIVHFVGILHYFGAYPETRHYFVPVLRNSGETVFGKVLVDGNRRFTLFHSQRLSTNDPSGAGRLWIIVGAKWIAKEIKQNTTCSLKGYFDGSFLNYNRFPTDAPFYLFLCDSKSPRQKGIDVPIE